MNWKPISELPELVRKPGWVISENAKPLLLWLSDAKTFTPGSVAIWKDEKPQWIAVGYHGDWGVTHWKEIEPPATQEDEQ